MTDTHAEPSEVASAASPALVIALPQGLNVSGVTLWGVRLANKLSSRGWRCGLVLHAEPAGQDRLALPIAREVSVFDHPELPAAGEAMCDAEALHAVYARAVESLADGGPVVFSANLHGEVYGAAAALTRSHGVRLVGWQHSDIVYDTRVLSHYADALHAVVAVSKTIEQRLIEAMPAHAERVVRVPYGIELSEPRPRSPIAKRPLRLVYTGRLEHSQKRVLALPAMSRLLDERGVEHELVLVGDGPARDEVERDLERTPSTRMVGACEPIGVQKWLRWADALVLGSRYEGLSISTLEALAAGCPVLLTRTDSGASEAIEDGVSGMIADISPQADEHAAAVALADVVVRYLKHDEAELSAAARAVAAERYSVQAHADRVERVLSEVVREPALVWPAGRPVGFAAGGGSVPADASDRLERVLVGLANVGVPIDRVAIHGAGAHTEACAGVIRRHGITLVIDDDRARWGSRIAGAEVVSPDRAVAAGVRAVVISSHLHEQSIAAAWAERAGDAAGIAVHRLYETSNQAA